LAEVAVVSSGRSVPSEPTGEATEALVRVGGVHWRIVVQPVTTSPECCGECAAQTTYRLLELAPAHRPASGSPATR
jgi:hypothetical protein